MPYMQFVKAQELMYSNIVWYDKRQIHVYKAFGLA